jgi:hypothetical protein
MGSPERIAEELQSPDESLNPGGLQSPDELLSSPEPIRPPRFERWKGLAAPIAGIQDLGTALRGYATPGRDLTLTGIPERGDIEIDSRVLLAWADALVQTDGSPQRRAEQRIAKIQADLPGETSVRAALERWLGGKLIGLDVPRPQAQALGARILHILEVPETVVEEVLEIVREIPSDLLRAELLQIAYEIATLANDPGSVAQQLQDRMRLARSGLYLDLGSDDWNFGGALPLALLEILRGLKYEEAIGILTNWLNLQSSQSPELCAQFLQVAAAALIFLDQPSITKLYVEEEDDVMPLAPFKALDSGLAEVIEYLGRFPGYGEYVQVLQNAQAAIRARYFPVITGPLKDQVTGRPAEVLVPSLDDLAQEFLDWAKQQDNDHPEAIRDVAYTGLRMFAQSGAFNLELFCQKVAEGNQTLGRALRKEAVRFGMLPDPKRTLTREIAAETLQALEAQPWQDAAEIDFGEIIDEETTVLEVHFGPGTFVFHDGHWDTKQRVLDYFEYLDERDPEAAKHTKRIILYLPIPDVRRAPGYEKEKDWWEVGWAHERIGSMMIGLAEEDRNRVFITTLLQSKTAPDAASNIVHTMNEFKDKIEREAPHCKVVFRVFFGADELQWKGGKRSEKRVLQERSRQPRKVRLDIEEPDIEDHVCLCVALWGYIIDLLDALPGSAVGIDSPNLTTASNVRILNLGPGKEDTMRNRRLKPIPRDALVPSVSAIYQGFPLDGTDIPGVPELYREMLEEDNLI